MYNVLNKFSQDGGVDGKVGDDGDGHNKLMKSNSISVSEPRRGQTTAPLTHSGLTGPPGKTTVTRRRLRAPVWARSMSQKKLLPFFIPYTNPSSLV